MAGRGKKNCNEALRLALASGASIPAAAQQAACSESTVRRRLSDPAFRRSVAELRGELVSRVIGRLSALGTDSADVLSGLLQSSDERVRLGAVRTTLEHMFRGTELESVIREAEELKATVEQLTKKERA